MPLKMKNDAATPTADKTQKAARRSRGRMPAKTSINFAEIGVKRTKWWLAFPAIILILLAAFAIGKFLVYDRLAEVSAAEAEAVQAHQQLMDCYKRIDSYGELNDIYAHYTYSGMTTEELSRVDRAAVMDLLETTVFPRTEVSNWSLKGNKLVLSIEGETLQEINLTVQYLLESDMVDYCEVNTAATDGAWRTNTETLIENVTANIAVYLVKPQEVKGE